jgi:hypothetical protein
MTTFVTDCLVLKLEEYDNMTNQLDTTLYILYDNKEKTFVIRGKRRPISDVPSCTYSFTCKSETNLAYFVRYLIYGKNKVHEVLYNYDNFPYDEKDITYEFLNHYDNNLYEISGYNRNKMSRKVLIKNLRMLKNVLNLYN